MHHVSRGGLRGLDFLSHHTVTHPFPLQALRMVFEAQLHSSRSVSACLPIPSILAELIHRLFRDGTQRNMLSGQTNMKASDT